MKRKCHLIIIFLILYQIIIPIISNYFFCSTSTCMAAEKITPYKPQVQYSESYVSIKTEAPSKEIKTAKKKKLWPWIVGGLVVVGAAALGAGGGGGDGGAGDVGGGGGDEGGASSTSDNVDVDVSW